MTNQIYEKKDLYQNFCEKEKSFCLSNSVETLKDISDIYIEMYTGDGSVYEHDIFDSTMLLLSNNPSDELILHLEKKYELVNDNGMKVEILGLIKMIKMHL